MTRLNELRDTLTRMDEQLAEGQRQLEQLRLQSIFVQGQVSAYQEMETTAETDSASEKSEQD